MHKVSVDDMFSGKKSRYALVIGVAKRAREIATYFNENDLTKINQKGSSLLVDFFV